MMAEDPVQLSGKFSPVMTMVSRFGANCLGVLRGQRLDVLDLILVIV